MFSTHIRLTKFGPRLLVPGSGRFIPSPFTRVPYQQHFQGEIRNPEPKSGTKFCQQNIAVKHACIELKFGSNVDYRLVFEMHISIFLHLSYLYFMQVKYRTMSWNTDPEPTFSVLTMSRNSYFSITENWYCPLIDLFFYFKYIRLVGHSIICLCHGLLFAIIDPVPN